MKNITKCLNSIGISTKNIRGEFKTMSVILTEISNRWDLLSGDLKRRIIENFLDHNNILWNDEMQTLDLMLNIITKMEENDMNDNTLNHEVYEDLNKYYITVSVPGFDINDMDLNIKNNSLYLNLKENEYYDKINRAMSIKIYDDIDKINHGFGMDINNPELIINFKEEINEKNIKAEIKNGLLNISINKLIVTQKININKI